MLIFKSFGKNFEFITNGYDYWFLNNTELRLCAVIATLDYYNCQINLNEKSNNKIIFNKNCYTEIIKENYKNYKNFYFLLKIFKKNISFIYNIFDIKKKLKFLMKKLILLKPK